MNTVLDVEIFAVAVGVVGESGLGHVGHHVEIVTETDILYLPVTANILLLNLSWDIMASLGRPQKCHSNQDRF